MFVIGNLINLYASNCRFLGEQTILLSEALKTETYLQSIWNAIANNEPLKERLLDRSTVASATTLQSNDNPNEILLVGNTHLYFHPDADHIRLIQGGIVIYWLRHLRHNLIKQVSIVCIDIEHQLKKKFKKIPY